MLEARYLKEISGSLAKIHSLQKQQASPVSRNRLAWWRTTSLVLVAMLVISSPYVINQLYGAGNLDDASGSNENGQLGIESLVRQVQEEIEKSEKQRKAQNIAPMFQVSRFELEIAFVVSRKTTQSGSAKFEAVAVDNQVQTGAERTHRLKLIMDLAPSYEGAVGPSESQPPTDSQELEPLRPGKGQKK